MGRVEGVNRKLAEVRKTLAACTTDLERATVALETAADNEAAFLKASVKLTAAERRLAVFEKKEAALVAELPAATKVDRVAEVHRNVDAAEKRLEQAAARFRREYLHHTEALVPVLEEAEAVDRLIDKVNREAREAGVDRCINGRVETLARPPRGKNPGVFWSIVDHIILPGWDHGGGDLWSRRRAYR